ncbi:hypothetical protein N431DRAFT_466974 [Stipitochalara longipes BDJ]|nr:hypothetical protein N431DRAFT_466974 [Stipitochalara longipes BDJ]
MTTDDGCEWMVVLIYRGFIAVFFYYREGLKGKLWVESSTVDPATITKLATIVEEGGVNFLAMPVFGAAALGIAGQLVCVPARPKTCVDRICLFLNGVMGRSTIDMSDQPHEKAYQLERIGDLHRQEEPLFDISLARKGARHAIELAEQNG